MKLETTPEEKLMNETIDEFSSIYFRESGVASVSQSANIVVQSIISDYAAEGKLVTEFNLGKENLPPSQPSSEN